MTTADTGVGHSQIASRSDPIAATRSHDQYWYLNRQIRQRWFFALGILPVLERMSCDSRSATIWDGHRRK